MTIFWISSSVVSTPPIPRVGSRFSIFQIHKSFQPNLFKLQMFAANALDFQRIWKSSFHPVSSLRYDHGLLLESHEMLSTSWKSLNVQCSGKKTSAGKILILQNIRRIAKEENLAKLFQRCVAAPSSRSSVKPSAVRAAATARTPASDASGAVSPCAAWSQVTNSSSRPPRGRSMRVGMSA